MSTKQQQQLIRWLHAIIDVTLIIGALYYLIFVFK